MIQRVRVSCVSCHADRVVGPGEVEECSVPMCEVCGSPMAVVEATADVQITGAFVRIMRNGKAYNLEIIELTDKELDAYFDEQPPLAVKRWARFLAGWIRDHIVDGKPIQKG